MLDQGGGTVGFSSMLQYVQSPDIGVVVLQNSDSSGDHDDPESIARKLTAAALGEPYPAATAIAMGVAALKQVEGVYRIDAESNGEPPGTVVARTQHPLPTARQEVPLRRQELD